MPFPSGLKPFLRFQKLPGTALAQARAAIEGDVDFRKRLASLATIDFVDQLGLLWLTRPDGWSETVAEIRPVKLVDDEAALRREERRRLAAQASALRGRVELLNLATDLERERTAKSDVMAEFDRLRGELDDMRTRLREAQRAEHAAAQALAKVESELHDARSTASVPEPNPVAEPTSRPVIDTTAVRTLLDDAVSASTDALRLLTAAIGELHEVDDQAESGAARPERQGHARRKAIRLPGGVLADTVESAEFLLRSKGARTLIDGYNVAKLGWPSLDLDHQREQCIVAAENMAKRWNMTVTIVFDGATIEGAHTSTRRRVRIVYSPAGVSADDVLRAEVACVDVGKPVVVVTNDRAIITDVVAAGANTVSSDDFLVLLRR